jgi:predicted naringenin-chalcone synthase
VPELIRRNLRPWLVEWLRRQGLELDQVASWAIHPGGPKILSAAQETLGLSPAAVDLAWEIFAHHGNMSSPTILFLLDLLQQRQAARPCVALGFGPGLTAEAALFS